MFCADTVHVNFTYIYSDRFYRSMSADRREYDCMTYPYIAIIFIILIVLYRYIFSIHHIRVIRGHKSGNIIKKGGRVK
jgi:hypothetical protein